MSKVSSFTSILRGINRPPNDKLNILSINFDEKFQSLLAKTGHNFIFAALPSIRPWNNQIREKPENCLQLENNDFLEDNGIDLILCQDRLNHYETLASTAIKLSTPIIGIDNYLPVPELNQFQVQALADRIYNKNIVCSKFTANTWGLDDKDVVIAQKAVYTDLFDGWEGGDGKILTNVDWYHNRKNVTGFSLWEKLKQQFKMFPIGHSPGLSEIPKNTDELVSVYKRASVFLNTSSWLSCPIELLEAMSCGVPVISTKNCDVDFIEHGINGFCSNDFNEIVRCIKLLLNDKGLAKNIGINGRKTIIEKFSQQKFIENWNQIFGETIDMVCALLRS